MELHVPWQMFVVTVLYDHENSVIMEVNVPNILLVATRHCLMTHTVMKKVIVIMHQMRCVLRDEVMAVLLPVKMNQDESVVMVLL